MNLSSGPALGCSPGADGPATYHQLLGVRGECSHFPNRLCPPEDEGQAGPLACDTGDIHTLQGVQVDLPYLEGCRQPAVPARTEAFSSVGGQQYPRGEAASQGWSTAATRQAHPPPQKALGQGCRLMPDWTLHGTP